jgi:hypothetical protein
MTFIAVMSLVVNLTLLGMVVAIFYILNSVWFGPQNNQPALVVTGGSG